MSNTKKRKLDIRKLRAQAWKLVPAPLRPALAFIGHLLAAGWSHVKPVITYPFRRGIPMGGIWGLVATAVFSALFVIFVGSGWVNEAARIDAQNQQSAWGQPYNCALTSRGNLYWDDVQRNTFRTVTLNCGESPAPLEVRMTVDGSKFSTVPVWHNSWNNDFLVPSSIDAGSRTAPDPITGLADGAIGENIGMCFVILLATGAVGLAFGERYKVVERRRYSPA